MKTPACARLSLIPDRLPQRPPHSPRGPTPLYNLPVCAVTGVQQQTASTADGSGGVIVTWLDRRSSNDDIYAQQVLSRVRWIKPGPCRAALLWRRRGQGAPAITGDGAGGAIVVGRLAEADRVRSTRSSLRHDRPQVAGEWPTPPYETACRFPPGRNRRAIVAWCDSAAAPSIYAQHVRANSGRSHVACERTRRSAPRRVTRPIRRDRTAPGGMLLTWHDLGQAQATSPTACARSTSVVDPAWPVNSRATCTLADGAVRTEHRRGRTSGAIIAGDIRKRPELRLVLPIASRRQGYSMPRGLPAARC